MVADIFLEKLVLKEQAAIWRMQWLVFSSPLRSPPQSQHCKVGCRYVNERLMELFFDQLLLPLVLGAFLATYSSHAHRIHSNELNGMSSGVSIPALKNRAAAQKTAPGFDFGKQHSLNSSSRPIGVHHGAERNRFTQIFGNDETTPPRASPILPIQRLNIEAQVDRGGRLSAMVKAAGVGINSLFAEGSLESLLLLASIDALNRKVDLHCKYHAFISLARN